MFSFYQYKSHNSKPNVALWTFKILRARERPWASSSSSISQSQQTETHRLAPHRGRLLPVVPAPRKAAFAEVHFTRPERKQ